MGRSWCSRGSWADAARARHRPPTPGSGTRGQLPTPPSLGPALAVATLAALWAGTAGASCPSGCSVAPCFAHVPPGPALSGSRSQLSLSLPQLPNLKVGSHTKKKTGSRATATPSQAFLCQLVGPRDSPQSGCHSHPLAAGRLWASRLAALLHLFGADGLGGHARPDTSQPPSLVSQSGRETLNSIWSPSPRPQGPRGWSSPECSPEPRLQSRPGLSWRCPSTGRVPEETPAILCRGPGTGGLGSGGS